MGSFFFLFLTTYTMYSHNTPYSYKERDWTKTLFFFYILHPWHENNEPRTILKLKKECSCQLCRFIFIWISLCDGPGSKSVFQICRLNEVFIRRLKVRCICVSERKTKYTRCSERGAEYRKCMTSERKRGQYTVAFLVLFKYLSIQGSTCTT